MWLEKIKQSGTSNFTLIVAFMANVGAIPCGRPNANREHNTASAAVRRQLFLKSRDYS